MNAKNARAAMMTRTVMKMSKMTGILHFDFGMGRL